MEYCIKNMSFFQYSYGCNEERHLYSFIPFLELKGNFYYFVISATAACNPLS